MQTTVTTLLREFPKLRRAAMAGARVVIKTRQGNLVLTAEKAAASPLIGCMKGRGSDHGLAPRSPTFGPEWVPTL
jgi:hypothetical protein